MMVAQQNAVRASNMESNVQRLRRMVSHQPRGKRGGAHQASRSRVIAVLNNIGAMPVVESKQSSHEPDSPITEDETAPLPMNAQIA